MFRVRHAHFPAPNASSTPSTPPSSYALLSTRQSASAFNQPLSLDTSSVTTMKWMFKVRSARSHAKLASPLHTVVPPLRPTSLHKSRPPISRGPHLSCTLLAPSPPTSSNLQAHIPLTVCPPFDSAESVGIQPAAELRHVERHKYGRDVSRAFRACALRTAVDGTLACTLLASLLRLEP